VEFFGSYISNIKPRLVSWKISRGKPAGYFIVIPNPHGLGRSGASNGLASQHMEGVVIESHLLGEGGIELRVKVGLSRGFYSIHAWGIGSIG